MRQLDYARDNRLRLWFLGCADWKRLDATISPTEGGFVALMTRCLRLWHEFLHPMENVSLFWQTFATALTMPSFPT